MEQQQRNNNFLDLNDIGHTGGQAIGASFENHYAVNNITPTSDGSGAHAHAYAHARDSNRNTTHPSNNNVALSVTLQPESVFATRLANQQQQQQYQHQQQKKNPATQDLNSRFSLYPVNESGSVSGANFNLAGGGANTLDAHLGSASNAANANVMNGGSQLREIKLNPRSYDNLLSLAALQNRKNDNVYVSSQRTVASGPVLGTSDLLRTLQRNKSSLDARPSALAASSMGALNEYPSAATSSLNAFDPSSSFLDNSDLQSVASERLANTLSIPRFDGSVADPNVNRFSFPMKLHDMLSRVEYSHIICWLDNGKAWMVLDQTNLEKQVLRRYFRHGKYSSFSRQVNGWGFMRITSGDQRNAYYHELFVRDNPRQCMLMRRQYATTATTAMAGESEVPSKKTPKSKKVEKQASAQQSAKRAQPQLEVTASSNAYSLELSPASNGMRLTADVFGGSSPSVGVNARSMPSNLHGLGQGNCQWDQSVPNPQTAVSALDVPSISSGPHAVSINPLDLSGTAAEQSGQQKYQSYEQRWLSLDAMVNKRAEEANELHMEASGGAQTDAQDLFARLLSQGNTGSSTTASLVPQPALTSYDGALSGSNKVEMSTGSYINQNIDPLKPQLNHQVNSPLNGQLNGQLNSQLNANHQQQSDQNDYLNKFLQQCAMANAQGQQQQLQQLQQQLQQQQRQISNSAVAQLDISRGLNAYSPTNNLLGSLSSYQQNFQDPAGDFDLQATNLNLIRSNANNQVLLNQLTGTNGGSSRVQQQLGFNVNLSADNLGLSQNSAVNGYNAGYPDTNTYDGFSSAEHI
eukprot:CAMPEP_0196823248 /NCGR_PEP_ID=MMETSP1362-20130617/86710_1 /TAXON_ID=163516 /ORGANISM="Leptocylindrus danicus, Strain CCMP1856" /LENGTH=805 /DNA_ID=CAMNT_0042203063 /DNA_START=43 /DNA_END=2460 /DNA_ORIENTATION=-